MCKALTRELRRCRHPSREGDYCSAHNLNIRPNGDDTNGPNLASICSRIRNSYFDTNLRLYPQFSHALPNEQTRQYIFGEVMPFLRDCWKMGIGNTNFPIETLQLHYEVLGEPTQIELPPRRLTPEQRENEHTLLREAMQQRLRAAMRRPLNYNGLNVIPQQEVLNNAILPPPLPPPLSNLPSISNDPQSVHRESVNKSVTDSIKVLKLISWSPSKWPILHESGKLPGGRKLFEYIYLWSDIYKREESKELFPKLFPLLEKNYISGLVNIEDEVFGIKPWTALYKVCQWTWERPLEEQKEIFKRMLDEIYEGRDMCLQGKVSRIINILCGFHPEIQVGLSGKEMLQDRMARLANQEGMDIELRMEEGRGILRDAAVPEEEWNVWLEPLLLF